MSALPDITPAEAALESAFAVMETQSTGRLMAWDAFARTGLPHRRMEAWRWSDVRRAVPNTLRFPPAHGAPDHKGLFSAVNPIELVFVDGRFAAWPKDDPDAARIVREVGEPGAPADAARLPLGALSAALAPDPQMIVLAVTEPCARPIWLRFIAGTQGAARLTRVSVIVAPDASATVLETHEGGSAGFGSTFIEAVVGAGGRLDRVVAQRGVADDIAVSTADVRVHERARFNQASLSFGAKLARLETHVRHEGEDAEATIDGAKLLAAARHADDTTVITHAVPNGVTRQLFKTVVKDQASAVFQGRIEVARAAQKTDARMGHHALLLNRGASVNAKPELEIYADDVQCAHGNTAGALDPEQLFYLQARGLPEALAKALVAEAFVAEAFENVADDAVRDILMDDVRTWLGGGSAL